MQKITLFKLKLGKKNVFITELLLSCVTKFKAVYSKLVRIN